MPPQEPSQQPHHAPRHRGLEELRWPSLTFPERLAVAALLARPNGAPAHAHLDHVALELACDGGPVPLVLTPLQNRAVAQAIEGFAAELEVAADRFPGLPSVARTAHYSAGYLRSLLDRLVKAGAADAREGLERMVELLAVEAPPGATGGALVDRALERLAALGAAKVLEPVLPRYAEEAVQHCRLVASSAGVRPDDADFELQIVDVAAERSELARRVFAAALASLRGRDADGDAAWAAFMGALRRGSLEGCRSAPDYPEVAHAAAHIARLIATTVRNHLRELAGLPWEAVSPGLKAILGRYPALKREASLRDFVRAEIRRAAGRGAVPPVEGPP